MAARAGNHGLGAWEIIAFPPSQDHDTSLHIDLTRTRLSIVEAGSVLNQLLSIAAWLDDNFAVLLPGWEGNPVPCRPPRRLTHPLIQAGPKVCVKTLFWFRNSSYYLTSGLRRCSGMLGIRS